MSFVEETIDRALTAAGLAGRAGSVRRAIDSALTRAGLLHRAPAAKEAGPQLLKELNGIHVPVPEEIGPTEGAPDPGFTSHLHEGSRGSLAYKLFVPSSYSGQPLPLIVMLHGCKQNPDDFAAGTRMNLVAEQRGFLAVYPAQDVRANGSNCWNWFNTAEQGRDGREASLIAGIVDEVAQRVATSRSQVFVAGLSAGGAMAVILGNGYPDLFAGMAVHSGLPLGAANDVPSALAAMRGRGTSMASPGRMAATSSQRGVRTLVLHGDADFTVSASNGDAVVGQAVAAFERAGGPLSATPALTKQINGRQAVRVDYANAQGEVMVRDLRVHGGGHAWFGGSPTGSFTDATGPDASTEIASFFLPEEQRSVGD